jgi:hypothetical protein
LGRGLRFPSSRRYLWDRTAAGPQLLIDSQVQWAGPLRAASTHLSRASVQRGICIPRAYSGKRAYLLVQETCSHVQVATSAFASITAAAAQGAPNAKLQVTLAVSSSYKVTALIQALDRLPGDHQLLSKIFGLSRQQVKQEGQ